MTRLSPASIALITLGALTLLALVGGAIAHLDLGALSSNANGFAEIGR